MTTANHIRVFQNFVNAIDKAHQLWFANWAFQYGAPSEVRSEDDGVQPGFVYRPVDENSTGIEDVEAMISVERCYVEDQ